MRSRVTRTSYAVVTVLVAGSVLLGGCGGHDPTAVPTVSGSAPALWNPCDGLSAAQVGRLFSTTMSVETGTATAPLCRFTPDAHGAPVIDANYSLFPAGLAAAISSFPQSIRDASVTTVRVPGAEDARLVVSRSKGTLLVTGFVQNSDLIQVVNAVDPPPNGRSALVSGVRRLMAALSRHASESGLTTPTSPPTR